MQMVLYAFNADGSFKGLGNVFTELNDKLKGMTDEQKNYYLAMIGGKTQVDALQKILDGVGDEYEDLKGKIVDSKDALNTMADVMNDNSKGGIAQLKSALEEAGIAIYQTLKPAIASITEKIQETVNWFNGLDESTKKNITTFAMIALGVGRCIITNNSKCNIYIYCIISSRGNSWGSNDFYKWNYVANYCNNSSSCSSLCIT